MHLDPVELAVGRGAEMIFDVARAADVLGDWAEPPANSEKMAR